VSEGTSPLSIDASGFGGGLHRVGTRFVDDLGNWSEVRYHDLFVFDLATVEADETEEAQVDLITVNAMPAVGTNVSVKIGPKQFAYQVKDSDNLSSVREGLGTVLSQSPMVYVQNEEDGRISITGRYDGHQYSVETDETISVQSIQLSNSGFPEGAEFKIAPQITGAEYFIDSDPGEGNGLSVGAEDLVYDSATEGIAALSLGINDVAAGARRMGLRFRDQDGNWSTPRYIDFESEDAGEYIPSRVEINPRSIDENLTPGNWQGTLSTVDWNDPDANGTYTYALVNDNTTDNSSFSISGNHITATRIFDYELEKSLSLKVRTTDDTNRSVITNLTIRINDNRLEDLDQDGLTQSEEGQLGTSDVQTDSDGDGVSDHAEVLAGSDPLFAKSVPGQAPKNLRLDPDTVQENQTVGSIVSRLFTDDPDDPQGRDVYAYTFEQGVDKSQNDYFSIGQNGSLTLLKPLNFEQLNTLSIRVKVTDSIGLSFSKALVLTVTDDKLEDSDGDGLNQFAEEKAGTSDSLTDTDADGFSDFAEVNAGTDPTDYHSSPNLAPVQLRVLSLLAISENQPVGSVVGICLANDPENHSLDFSLVSGYGDDLFAIESNGTLKTLAVFDYEQHANNYSLKVRVRDQYGASLTADFTVSVTNEIEDLDGDGVENHADDDDDGDGYPDAVEIAYGSDPMDANSIANAAPNNLRSLNPLVLPENSAIGQEVGKFVANDSDGDDLIFEFVDGDQTGDHSYFTLLADGTLRSAIILDYEVDAKSYQLNIKVSDSRNASLQKLFTVTVENKIEDFDGDGVEDFFDEDDDGDGFSDLEETAYGSDPLDSKSVANQKPAFQNTESIFTILEDQSAGTLVAQFEVTDPDNDAFSFSVITGSGHFMIDNSGILKSKQIFDYENGTRQFQLLIRVTDEHGAFADKNISVSVLDDSSDNVVPPSPPTIPDDEPVKDQFSKLNVETLDGRMENDTFWLQAKVSAHPGRGQLGFTLLSFTNQVKDFFYNGELSEELIFQMKINHSEYTYFKYYRAFMEVDGVRIFGKIKRLNIIQTNFELGPFENQLGTNGWIESEWFGVFKPVSNQWLYHTRLGWIYFSPVDSRSFWFWKESQGWLWTEEDLWPFMWSHTTSGWLYLIGDKGMTFYNYERQIWESSVE